MGEPGTHTTLLQRLQAGDAQAATEVFALYAHKLRVVAQHQLSRKVTAREDGDDVVQSAFRTFFRRSARGDFQISESEQLWRLLVKITVLKARAKRRFHTAAKRDVGTEAGASGEDWLQAAAAREPGPEEAVILLDQIEHLLRGLPALYGDILHLRLQDLGASEIAQRTAVSRQTVYRALDLLQQRLVAGGADGALP